MTRLIIFDWDDVFTLGSTRGYHACYHKAAIGVGVELDPAEEERRIASKWGSPHRIELEALLVENPELVDEAVKIYEEALFGDVFVDELTLVDGAKELLKGMEGRYKLAIASGINPKLLKERVFRKFDIPQIFDKIITSYDLDDPRKAKPHPHMIELVIEYLGVKPQDTLMVGDARNDMLMGKRAGTQTAAVLTGHLSRQEAIDLQVDHVLEDVTKLTSVLH